MIEQAQLVHQVDFNFPRALFGPNVSHTYVSSIFPIYLPLFYVILWDVRLSTSIGL